MFTLYKYPIPVEDEFALDLPIGAQILCVQAQREEPQIWAIVDPEQLKQSRRFALLGTGHPIDAALADLGKTSQYRGTFQLREGTLVFHLFERM